MEVRLGSVSRLEERQISRVSLGLGNVLAELANIALLHAGRFANDEIFVEQVITVDRYGRHGAN